MSALYASPTRSIPPFTFGAAGPNSFRSAGAVLVAAAAANAALPYFQEALTIAKFDPGMYEVVETYSGTATEP